MSSFAKSDIDKVFLINFKEKLLEGEDIINFLGNNTIDKKISTGGDDQGRIYYTKTGRDDRKYIVLIGHKQNQKQDIEYLRKDHKKDLDM